MSTPSQRLEDRALQPWHARAKVASESGTEYRMPARTMTMCRRYTGPIDSLNLPIYETSCGHQGHLLIAGQGHVYIGQPGYERQVSADKKNPSNPRRRGEPL